MKAILSSNWSVIQDVHDTAEAMRLFEGGFALTDVGHQLSEWEQIDRLEHLQVIFAQKPYWGRELRYFNQAPWWYRNSFTFDAESGARTVLRFSNVDYFCKVWLNGVFLGEHEGYSVPFEFEVSNVLRQAEPNELIVKVWSPWDNKIRDDAYAKRTSQIERSLVKGTYEHDDTLVARDVNPVGIYGEVSLTSAVGPSFKGRPRVIYVLSDDLASANITVRGVVVGTESKNVHLTVRLSSEETIAKKGVYAFDVESSKDGTEFEVTFSVSGIELWNLWDQGNQPLYELILSLEAGETQHRRIAFRQVELKRDDSQTTFHFNGRRTFVRGTSYFPDVYVSTMTRERYWRDLLLIKAAGFNLVRVHVHVENEIFYSLCDELGVGVIQDSEYNWTHPVSRGWAERITAIFEQTILLLDDHPSVICWICLNEPGVLDASGRTHGFAMEISPGPRLYAAVVASDPSRPAIKGSFCFDDPTSGDSHNYIGSLQGPDVPYTDIDGTSEKLNTEFGFDAPGCIANLRRTPELLRRLSSRIELIEEAQTYQYRLIKYYIEHYRAQKYKPCSGYVHFMFIDLCPQSFYGIYDWWGTPKPALEAFLESNQPVIAMIETNASKAEAIWLINDSNRDLGRVTVTWTLVDGATGSILAEGNEQVACGPDSKLLVGSLAIERNAAIGPVNATVVARDDSGLVLARNRYHDMFGHPEHIKGHPTRMSHEYGMRLYSA